VAKLSAGRQVFFPIFPDFSFGCGVVVVVPKGCTANWQCIVGGSRIFWQGSRMPSACPGGKLAWVGGKSMIRLGKRTWRKSMTLAFEDFS